MVDPASTEPDAPPLLTGSSVGRFAIGERLGVGGMGEVYRAQDTRLNRSVAIKRMSGALRSDPAQRRRFLKEAERASQLTAPHVAALYDILEEQGEIFLVMEFVQGCNLRERLYEKTSLKDFLALAIQAAEGLRSAHAQGVIHCDIKPENIMISPAGQVKILDFGLARQLSSHHAGPTFTSATAGISGTPGYMAPEVMLEAMPDARSDIFSLGVVFYEALSGTHPFRKRTVIETAESVLHTEPPSLESLGSPPRLSQIVARMMAKDPAQRHASAEELITDLKAFAETAQSGVMLASPAPSPPERRTWQWVKHHRLLAIAALVIVAAAIMVAVAIPNLQRVGRALGLSKAPQIAVLPFQSIGGERSDKAFAEGLSDVITSELTQLSDRYVLQVVPANDVRSQGVNSAQAARQQFGVDLVVEGSLQPVANMLRATYSVVDAHTGRQVRAGTVSVSAGDPFGLQDQLANGIVRALGIEVRAGERARLAGRGTTVSAAYDDYLQGLGYLEDYQNKENLNQAIASFNRALEHDSSYALAYAGLGEAHWHKYREFNDASEISDAALACERAAAIESDLVEAHRCLGEVYASSGRYKEAAQQLEMAVSKRPTDDESVRALGMAYERLRDFAQAEATYRRAIDLRPHYWGGYSWLGAFYASRGQYDKALQMFERVVATAPDNYRGYNNAGGIYIFQGNFEKAIKEFERSVQLRPSFAGYSNLGTAYFFQGHYPEAAAAYTQAVKLNERDYVSWGNLGDAQYFAPGQRGSSPDSYRKAIELGEAALQVNPKNAGALGSVAMYYAMLGQKTEAEDYLRRALALKPEGPDMWWQASVVYAQLGRVDDTLGALQSALAAGLSSAYIKSAPYFNNLQTDARFQQLIKSAEKLERH